jgi:hypothetical protein
MESVAGMRRLASGYIDVPELETRVSQAAVAQNVIRAGSCYALHILRRGRKFGPTAYTRNSGEHLHHHRDGKFEQPQSRCDIQINGEIVKSREPNWSVRTAAHAAQGQPPLPALPAQCAAHITTGTIDAVTRKVDIGTLEAIFACSINPQGDSLLLGRARRIMLRRRLCRIPSCYQYRFPSIPVFPSTLMLD